jgi:hypothetical protein
MPVIRYDFNAFVRTWNGHKIRKQKNRPHVVSGIPYVLYHMPNPDTAIDCRIPLPKEYWSEIRSAIQKKEDFDIEAYLPQEIMSLCDNLIISLGGIPKELPDGTENEPWLEQYLGLREALQNHEKSHATPQLCLLTKPVGDKNFYDDVFQRESPLFHEADDVSSCDEGEYDC